MRNALAVAESALFLAQRDVDDRPRLTRHLDQVGAEIRKAHHVIGSVLGLARGEPVRREPAPVGRLVDTARHALVLPTNVTFEVAIDPGELTVLCDPILLERVFSNLYLNAIEALAGRPRAAIVTRAWLGDERTYLEVEGRRPRPGPRHRRPHLRAAGHLQGRRHRARPGAQPVHPGGARRGDHGDQRAPRGDGVPHVAPERVTY